MFERFTDRARRIVVLAQDESRALDHDYIGTEHILLGLLRLGEGPAYQALSSEGVELDAVREHVVEHVGRAFGEFGVFHFARLVSVNNAFSSRCWN